ncbi:MAG TPA: hypothetical protein VGB79_04955 [Allosphingosinicella sp.]|jgi:hypothetical protein
MSRLFSRRTAIAAGIATLLACLIPLSQPFRHAAAWRVPSEHARYVDLALTGGAEAFGMSREEYRRVTRPYVEQDRRRTCVALDTHRSDGGGSYSGCYDSRTGAPLSDLAIGISFGPEGLWNRFGQWVW